MWGILPGGLVEEPNEHDSIAVLPQAWALQHQSDFVITA